MRDDDIDWSFFTPIEDDSIDWSFFTPIDDSYDEAESRRFASQSKLREQAILDERLKTTPRGGLANLGVGLEEDKRPAGPIEGILKEAKKDWDALTSKPKSLMEGYAPREQTEQEKIARRGGPVTEEFAEGVRRFLEKAAPEEREQLMNAPGVLGSVAKAQNRRNEATPPWIKSEPEPAEYEFRADWEEPALDKVGRKLNDKLVAIGTIPAQTFKFAGEIASLLTGGKLDHIENAAQRFIDWFQNENFSEEHKRTAQEFQQLLENEAAQPIDIVKFLVSNPGFASDVAIPSLGALGVVKLGAGASRLAAETFKAWEALPPAARAAKIAAVEDAGLVATNTLLNAANTFSETEGSLGDKYLAAGIAAIGSYLGSKATDSGLEGALLRSTKSSVRSSIASIPVREAGQEAIEAASQSIGEQIGETGRVDPWRAIRQGVAEGAMSAFVSGPIAAGMALNNEISLRKKRDAVDSILDARTTIEQAANIAASAIFDDSLKTRAEADVLAKAAAERNAKPIIPQRMVDVVPTEDEGAGEVRKDQARTDRTRVEPARGEIFGGGDLQQAPQAGTEAGDAGLRQKEGQVVRNWRRVPLAQRTDEELQLGLTEAKSKATKAAIQREIDLRAAQQTQPRIATPEEAAAPVVKAATPRVQAIEAQLVGNVGVEDNQPLIAAAQRLEERARKAEESGKYDLAAEMLAEAESLRFRARPGMRVKAEPISDEEISRIESDISSLPERIGAKNFVRSFVAERLDRLPPERARLFRSLNVEGWYDPQDKTLHIVPENIKPFVVNGKTLLSRSEKATVVAAHEILHRAYDAFEEGKSGSVARDSLGYTETLRLAHTNPIVAKVVQRIAESDRQLQKRLLAEGDVEGAAAVMRPKGVLVEEAIVEIGAHVETQKFDALRAKYGINAKAFDEGVVRRVWNTFANGVRRMLRRLGIETEFSNGEVLALLRDMKGALKKAGRAVASQQAGEIRQSRGADKDDWYNYERELGRPEQKQDVVASLTEAVRNLVGEDEWQAAQERAVGEGLVQKKGYKDRLLDQIPSYMRTKVANQLLDLAKVRGAAKFKDVQVQRKRTKDVAEIARRFEDIGKKMFAGVEVRAEARSPTQFVNDQGEVERLNSGRIVVSFWKDGTSLGSASLSLHLDDVYSAANDAGLEFEPYFVAHTSLLNRGSGIGSYFYQLAERVAKSTGIPIFPDTGLTPINKKRRTEQMLSAALRNRGITGTIQPAPDQGVTGWKQHPKNEREHKENLLRLALTSMNNHQEVLEFFDEIDYDAESDRFVYRDGSDATDFVETKLGQYSAISAGVTRGSLIRNLLFRDMIDGFYEKPESLPYHIRYSRGATVEVAPNPDKKAEKAEWKSMPKSGMEYVTREVVDYVAANMRRLGHDVKIAYTSGMFEGEVNPSFIVDVRDGSFDDVVEAGRVFGYILDQKAIVVFDEDDQTNGSQAGFVKIDIDPGVSKERIDEFRLAISNAVPQAAGDTLVDGKLVFGNFSAYDDKVATLSDEEFLKAIIDATKALKEKGKGFSVVDHVFRFRSEYIQPENREGFLEGTRYGQNSQAVSGGTVLSGPWPTGSRLELERIKEGAERRRASRIKYVLSGLAEPAVRSGSGTLTPDGRGAVTVGGIHFSDTPNLLYLTGTSFGRGIRGLEWERIANAKDPRIKRRVYFYVGKPGDQADLGRREAGLGPHVYHATLGNMYLEGVSPKLDFETPYINKELGIIDQNERANRFESAILDAGYDGYLLKDVGVAVVLNKDVKVDYVGSVAERKLDVRYSRDLVTNEEDGPPFYSELRKQVLAINAKEMSAKDWLARINSLKGVKPEEIEWSGLRDFLEDMKGRDGKVSKEEILGLLQQDNIAIITKDIKQTRVPDDLREYLGGADETDPTTLNSLLTKIDKKMDQAIKDKDSETFNRLMVARSRVNSLLASFISSHDAFARYGYYATKPTKGYREVLLVLDPSSSSRKVGNLSFANTHYGTKNVVAHFRAQERTGKDGSRVLLIDEIQSDWAAEGRKYGFGEVDLVVDDRTDIIRRPKSKEELEEVKQYRPQDVIRTVKAPRAPFVSSTDKWVSLVVKRIIRYAAENGFDSVAWVGGKRQAERYTPTITATEVYVDPPGEFAPNISVWLKKDGKPATRDSALLVDKDGTILPNRFAERIGATGKNIASVLPKHIAEGILAAEQPKGFFGRFKINPIINQMKAFYDEGGIVHLVTNNLLRKFGGGEVKEIKIADLENGKPGNLLGFEITPELRRSAARGMPLFSIDTTNKLDSWYVPDETRLEKARRLFQDSLIRLKVIQNAIAEQGGIVNEQNDVHAAEERMYGRIQTSLIRLKNLFVEPLVKKAVENDVDLDELAIYAYAKFAPQRNAYIKSIRPDMEDGSGMSNEDAQAIIERAKDEGKYEALESLHADLMALTEATRRVLLEEGLIDQATYDTWSNLYPDYISLRGFENVSEDGEFVSGAGKKIDVRGKESIRALGRRTRAANLIEHAIIDYERAIIRAERNIVAKHLERLVIDNPDPSLWEINATVTKPSFDKRAGLVVMKTSEDHGENTIAVKHGGQTTYIRINDELLVRALKRTFVDEQGGLSIALAETVGVYNDWIRNTLTRYNPVFIVTNSMRDSLMGAVSVVDTLGYSAVPKYAAHFKDAMAAAWKSEAGTLDEDSYYGKMYREYEEAGGVTGGFFIRDAREISNEINKILAEAGKGISSDRPGLRGDIDNFVLAIRGTEAGKLTAKVFGYIERMGAASENMTRFAAYVTAREMGKSPAEAASIAKNLTTNFNRKGELGTHANALWLFYNASVQGSVRVLEAMSNPKVWPLLAGIAANGFLLAMVNAAFGGEDDDGEPYWDSIPSYEKERNLILMLPKTGDRPHYIKVPAPYGYNTFMALGYALADAGRNAINKKTGRTPIRAAADLASAIFGSFNPIGGAFDISDFDQMLLAASPTITDLPIQIGRERTAFGDRAAPPQIPFYPKPDSERVFLSKHEDISHRIARWLNRATGGNEAQSGAIDVLPSTITSVVRAATGGIGQFALDVTTTIINGIDPTEQINPRNVPFLNRVYGVIDEKNVAKKYYENVESIEKNYKQQMAAIKKGLIGGEFSDAENALMIVGAFKKETDKVMSSLYKAEIAIINDERLTEAERKLKRKEIQEIRRKAMERFNRFYAETYAPYR